MTRFELTIGNKNYSSWSLRSWLLLRHAGIAFEERRLRLDFAAGSPFKASLAALAPTGRVPVLVDDGFAVWDTLAIAETMAEAHPRAADGWPLWPVDARQRARARSLCAEMHAGFTALRTRFPMNIEAALPAVGAAVLRTDAAAAADLARIDSMWSGCLEASGGPFLFGAFGIVDAYYAPVCSRARTYGLPLGPAAAAYRDRILGLPAMQEWTATAVAEQDFIADDEPYRTAR